MLRYDIISKFITDINYEQSIIELNNLIENENQLCTQLHEIDDEISNIQQELSRLASELQDERKGAEKVNEYLSSYFGHETLAL